MRTALLLVASLLTSVGCTVRPPAPDAPAAGGSSPASPTAPVALAQAGDEFDQMIEICAIDGEQLQRFRARVEDRHTQMAKWNATPNGQRYAVLNRQRADARRLKDADTLARTEPEFAPLDQEQAALRAQLRADVMRELTPTQLANWAGHVLWTQRKLSAVVGRYKLTPEQAAEARRIGNTAAAEFVRELDLTTDPYLHGLWAVRDQAAQKIVEQVVTPEQQRAHDAARPATRPTTLPLRAN